MDNAILKRLLTEYEHKRLAAVYKANDRKKDLYEKYPELQKIDDKLSSDAIKTSKLLLLENDADLLDNLNREIDELKSKKANILKSLNLPEDYLKPTYECNICNDTGYTFDGYYSKMCNCLKQKMFDIEYNKSNIFNIKNDTFENFLSTYYSTDVNENKYNSKMSPRDNIELIKRIAISFIDNFNDKDKKNLLFTGNTGLGKTFLSSCIANELLKNGKTVLYQTCPIMLDTIIDYRFGKANVPKDVYEHILNVDLLIIDDLGTESLNSLKISELFNVINSRLLNTSHKTIISTNLSLQNLFASYDERIVSRIVGNYDICYFFGDDIRFKKR